MKLQQGQIWKQGDEYIRIIERERLTVKYKVMTDPVLGEGFLHDVSKKAFCRLIKGAELLKREPYLSDLPEEE